MDVCYHGLLLPWTFVTLEVCNHGRLLPWMFVTMDRKNGILHMM